MLSTATAMVGDERKAEAVDVSRSCSPSALAPAVASAAEANATVVKMSAEEYEEMKTERQMEKASEKATRTGEEMPSVAEEEVAPEAAPADEDSTPRDKKGKKVKKDKKEKKEKKKGFLR